MKIKVRNLGIIQQQVEIDLKPLTIFIGPNNSGKTWLAYTLAGIFGEYGRRFYLTEERVEDAAKAYPPLIEAIEKVLAHGTAKIDLIQFAEDYIAAYFNNISLQAKDWLSDFMSTQLTSFTALELSINLEDKKKQLIEHIQASSLHRGIGKREKPSFDMRKKKGERDVYMYVDVDYDKEADEKLPHEIIEGFLAREILSILHQSLYPNVSMLPTERSTFVMFPWNVAEEQRIAIGENKPYEQHLGRPLSAPITHYLLSAITMYKMGSQEKAKRERKESRTPEVKEYMRLAQILEQTILGGKVDLSHPEPDPTREIVFQPATGQSSLEISITSSMVKVLSPLVFYLRYFAMPGELLIIDEPEMNLHPKAQVQVIEFLAMLVNAGLHVLITTHSPYMVDHLANLTTAAEHTDKEAIRPEFYLQDSNAFISKENVSLYLFDHGTIKEIINDEEQDWDTFGEVSDRISEIFFML